MIGAIAGEIIGSRFEFNRIKSTEFELLDPECRFTVNTVLSVALAEAIMWDKDYCQLLKEYCHR